MDFYENEAIRLADQNRNQPMRCLQSFHVGGEGSYNVIAEGEYVLLDKNPLHEIKGEIYVRFYDEMENSIDLGLHDFVRYFTLSSIE